jgi:hypothetical protein
MLAEFKIASLVLLSSMRNSSTGINDTREACLAVANVTAESILNRYQ